ncbi:MULTISPECIES: acyl carrier protein [unclassified Mycobacterium]|uniref:acyl carrier protein n=1 Tax=unclassified Mycobacterium TaxID=2642494 RepID=UPI0007FF0C2D|nr:MULTISPECIES: acyl carrier protein [unclassified Mycobacterium]OBB37426.1 phosphopantetheine-binding protein [Mycobacterium sp. 852002-51961_SCH5331710]OBH01835.1 phosphopantetheine-binding protein [Mycobacterium sp. E136]
MSTVEDIQAAVLSELTAIAPEVDPEELEATVLLRDQVDLDSMDWLNFLQRVHKRFKVDIPEKDYQALRTLDDVVRYVEVHTA